MQVTKRGRDRKREKPKTTWSRGEGFVSLPLFLSPRLLRKFEVAIAHQPQLLQFGCPFFVSMSRARNLALAAALLAFAGAGLSFPFYMASLKQPVIDSSKPLPPQAIIRGPYINTGSRDIGPDYQSYPKK